MAIPTIKILLLPELTVCDQDNVFESGLVAPDDAVSKVIPPGPADGDTEGDTEGDLDGDLEGDTEGDLEGDAEGLPIKYLGIGYPCFSNHQQRCIGFQFKRNS